MAFVDADESLLFSPAPPKYAAVISKQQNKQSKQSRFLAEVEAWDSQ